MNDLEGTWTEGVPVGADDDEFIVITCAKDGLISGYFEKNNESEPISGSYVPFTNGDMWNAYVFLNRGGAYLYGGIYNKAKGTITGRRHSFKVQADAGQTILGGDDWTSVKTTTANLTTVPPPKDPKTKSKKPAQKK